MSRRWFLIPVDGIEVRAFEDAETAERLGGLPCPEPDDLTKRLAYVDGLLEQGYGPLVEEEVAQC